MRFLGPFFMATMVVAACREAPRDDVFIKGSDTMRELLLTWKEDFEGADEQGRVVVVTGGSSAGMYALLNGLADFAASSRPISDRELRIAERKGLNVQEMEVAFDGIEVIVHPAHPIRELSMGQLADIFSGRETSWRSFGGLDESIEVLVRDPQSGTRALFKDQVLEGRDYAEHAEEIPSTEAVVDAVARRRFSIGYVGMGAAVRDRVALVRLRAGDAESAVLPSPANVASGTYPLVRPLFLYAVVHPRGVVERFLDHVFGPEGQRAVEACGFVPVDERPHL